MGGWHPNQWAEHRHPTLKELDEAVPDRPVLLYERFTGPCVDQHASARSSSTPLDAAAPVHPGHQEDRRCPTTASIAAAGFAGGGPSASALFHLRRLQTFEDKKRSTLDAMAYSASVGPDRASRPGAVPDAGTAAPEPDPVEPRSVPDVRLVARAASRRPRDHPAADELPAEPERPGAAGAEGAAEEPVPVLRRRHDDDRLDRRMGGAARRRRRLARGAAAGGAGRLAQREQRPEPRGADAGGRGVRGGQQGVRHHRPALGGPPRARGDAGPADAAQGARLRRADGRVPLGHVDRSEGRRRRRRSARSSITASRPASTATACTSRRSIRGSTSTSR